MIQFAILLSIQIPLRTHPQSLLAIMHSLSNNRHFSCNRDPYSTCKAALFCMESLLEAQQRDAAVHLLSWAIVHTEGPSCPYLRVCASVVDDNVSDGLDPILMHDRDELPQLSLCTVLAVEVVVVPGQVPLGTHSVTGRRQPDGCEACLSNGRDLVLQRLQICTDSHVRAGCLYLTGVWQLLQIWLAMENYCVTVLCAVWQWRNAFTALWSR